MLPGRSLILAGALVLEATAAGTKPRAPVDHQFTLPAHAMIQIGKPYGTQADMDQSTCGSYRLTRARVRTMFHTYHVITSSEMHDYYSFVHCGIEGTVKIGAKTFFWKSEPANTMLTDYPDGQEKMLGGQYSEDPAEN